MLENRREKPGNGNTYIYIFIYSWRAFGAERNSNSVWKPTECAAIVLE
jgi:hypothetical protein